MKIDFCDCWPKNLSAVTLGTKFTFTVWNRNGISEIDISEYSSPVVPEKYPAKIPTQAYLVPSEAEFCLVYPKKNPHSQHARDFFPVQKQNGRRTPLLKISKCNVKVKLQMLETQFSSYLDKIYLKHTNWP